MLVINGFFENGVFIPEKPLSGINGRQKAILRIEYEDDKQERLNADIQERIAAAERLVGIASKNTMTLEEIRNERLARQ